MANYLTQDDVQNYGSDLVDFAQRAAAQAVAPHLQALDQQAGELQRRLAVEARHRLDSEVAAAVPNYREIDSDPDWHRFLLERDALSGQVRQQLLNEAIASADARRVIAFFQGFARSSASQQSAPPQHRASSPRASTRSSAAGRTYTRKQIADSIPRTAGVRMSVAKPSGLGRNGTSSLRAAKGESPAVWTFTANRTGLIWSFELEEFVSLYFFPGPTIPAGQSLSNAIDLTTCRILRLIMPDAWTGNAPLTFQLSADGVVFNDLYHVESYTSAEHPSFVPYAVMVSAVIPSSTYALPPSTGDLIPFVRFRSGTAARPIVQEQDRVFGVVLDVSAEAGSAPPGWTRRTTWPPPPAAPAVRAVG